MALRNISSNQRNFDLQLIVMSTVANGGIHVETKYLPPDQPHLPALSLQVTQLVSSYMVWIGATEESAENANLAPLRGFLLRDWACAMPPSENVSSDMGHVYFTQEPFSFEKRPRGTHTCTRCTGGDPSCGDIVESFFKF